MDATDCQNPLHRGLNVLLVDDDEICLFIHQRVLEQSGLCRWTRSAGNGQKALDLLAQAFTGDLPCPDIIFLDLQMPVMDGLAFLEAFKQIDVEHRQGIAVVLLSSSVCEKERASATSLGASHCLTKPFTQDSLRMVVSSLYDSKEPFAQL